VRTDGIQQDQITCGMHEPLEWVCKTAVHHIKRHNGMFME